METEPTLPTIAALYDVSVPIAPAMQTMPGNRPTLLHDDQRLDRGDVANLSALTISLHAGTHVDASLHMFAGADGIDRLPLDRLVGPCWVAAIPGVPIVGRADLERAGIPAGTTRLLLKTANSDLWADPAVHATDYVGLDTDGAEWIVGRGIDVVGIDYLGIEPPGRLPPTTHHVLIGAGVTIIEGLNLNGIAPGPYLLLCLPLPIVGGDGSPARVVLAR